MKQARASLPLLGLVLGLTYAVAAPAAAQSATPAPDEPWRAHVTAFTAKLFGRIDDAHNQRDYFWARKLAAADHVTLDDDVIFAAAWLHDVGSMEGWSEPNQEHGDVAAAKLDKMPAGTDFPKDKMDRVREAMRTHMFYRDPVSAEARYLHDADALDNTGAIGIAWLLEEVDPKGGNFTEMKAVNIIQKDAARIESRVVTPAGKAEMAERISERKAIMDALARETNDFKSF